MKSITDTSTMSRHLREMINNHSKSTGKKKKEIIEQALEEYMHEMKKNAYRQGFAKIANDPDIVEMAELGMADYAKQLENY